MTNKEMLETFTNTLMGAWGGDAPPEAFWAMTDFVNWANQAFGLDCSLPPVEECTEKYDQALNEVIECIDNAITRYSNGC